MKEKSITPEGIINQAMGMNMSFTEAEFPVEIFPSMIQRIIHEVYECQSYPIDYTAASILTAIAAGIGNTHLVQMKQGWVESAILFVALVGRPGANKSHPLSFAMNLKLMLKNKNKKQWLILKAVPSTLSMLHALYN